MTCHVLGRRELMGGGGRKEMHIQNESIYQSCLMLKTCMGSDTVNYFTTFFIAVDLSSVLAYEAALFH